LAHERNRDGSTSKKTACSSANRLRTDPLHTGSFTHYRYGRYNTKSLRNLDPTRAGLPNLWANHVSRRRVQRMGDLRENGKRRTYLNLRSAKKDGDTEGGPPQGFSKTNSRFLGCQNGRITPASQPKTRGMSLPFSVHVGTNKKK